MFNRKTLFIVGAGAGFDIEMPVGRALAETIASRTKVGLDHHRLVRAKTNDLDFALSFFEQNDQKTNEYLIAFNLIHDGVLLASSIDDFLNIHENAPEVVTVGKVAIVRSILHAERQCKLFVDRSNFYNKLDIAKIRDAWFVKFMQVLAPGRKVPEVAKVLDDVSFITFNYDRCLEVFLRNALQRMYGIQPMQAAEIVSKANIIHPYGSVGTLESVPFGGNDGGRMDYRNLSKTIKTYTERIEEAEVLHNMQTTIREAQCIVFLGFAYHKQNMALLQPPYEQDRRQIKQVYGTAFGMSDSDVDEVVNELSSFFPSGEREVVGKGIGRVVDSGKNIRIENKLTCTQLFDYYAKSLAG
jgi:hypothetical protein